MHRFLIGLGANMAPFWLPKSFQILPKINFKKHQMFDWFWHRFLIDFYSNLEANLDPCWPPFWLKCGGANCPVTEPQGFFVGSSFFFDFFPGCSGFGRVLVGFGTLPKDLPKTYQRPTKCPMVYPIFDRFFGPNLVPTWRHLGPLWCKSWSWMGWWGYAKRKEFSDLFFRWILQ